MTSSLCIALLIALLCISCISSYRFSSLNPQFARLARNNEILVTSTSLSATASNSKDRALLLGNSFAFIKPFGAAVSGLALAIITINPTITIAKEEKPSLEKCFNYIQTELTERTSLNRIKGDIDEGKWDDLKLFTREYDATVRGSVMKTAWKQMEGDKKTLAIERSNSFTFDLIGVNKAARKQDKEEASKYYTMVEKDLKDFLALQEESGTK